jgi:8-oxo-dGTP pyrophosphatase MutT (NUDIX family)
MQADWHLILQERLKHPLPEIEAHLQMAPPQRFKEMAHYKPNAQTRESAVLILFYPKAGEIYFPLIQRPEYAGVHSGQVALPGGKKDAEDTDLTATALRETWEEIGVYVLREHVIGQLSTMYIPPSNFLVTPILAVIDFLPAFVPEAHEVVEILETDTAYFLTEDTRKQKIIQTKYMEAEVPYFDLHSRAVWGATAMILSELRWVMRDLFI